MNTQLKNTSSYIKNFPPKVQSILKKIRETIQKAAPQATEAISYGIPTFKLNGNLVHFAGFKSHVSLFPGSAGVAAFEKELSAYKISKGTIQFSLDKPVPHGLIRKITLFRVKQNLAKTTSKRASRKK